MQRGAPPESMRNVVNKDELREVAIELLLKEAVQVRRKGAICVCVCVCVCVVLWAAPRNNLSLTPTL